jgi:predicted acyl esterase
MVADQRFAARRPDVLVYQTDVLEEDVCLAGPIEAVLHVSTSGTDSDWEVKLIDVYPDDYPNPDPNPAGLEMGGYQQLVRGDVMRGKFRKSFTNPEPFAPNETAEVSRPCVSNRGARPRGWPTPTGWRQMASRGGPLSFGSSVNVPSTA